MNICACVCFLRVVYVTARGHRALVFPAIDASVPSMTHSCEHADHKDHSGLVKTSPVTGRSLEAQKSLHEEYLIYQRDLSSPELSLSNAK